MFNLILHALIWDETNSEIKKKFVRVIQVPFIPYEGLVITDLTDTKERVYLHNVSFNIDNKYFSADVQGYEHRNSIEIKRLTTKLLKEGWSLE